jgi:circadian clock protein KaiC
MDKVNSIVLQKTPSGIDGLDEITHGGFPKGRPILVCGGPGCGKTLMGIQFLVQGITEYNETGVLMTFEESSLDLSKNVSSLGFDLEKLKAENKLRVDHVRIESAEIEETGEYDLEALFVRLNYAIEAVGAKRVVLDTIESLFGGLKNTAVLRSEIRRLFQWLRDKGVTTIITGERGDASLTRQGLEEYVSDCVILLDFRVIDQIATRRLRIIKYRGSTHGTNEYPFLIDENGISVMPVTSLKLDYESPENIISTGLPQLDELFSRKGIYKASSMLITGTAGTAKTILASYFAASSCKRNERVLYFSFEESPRQLIRNMATLGIDFKKMIDDGLLHLHSSRPSLQGLELHLLTLFRMINEIKPQTLILDPISSLISIGSGSEVRAMLIRLIDMLKTNQINALFTSLTHAATMDSDFSTVGEISSLADSWINLQNINNGHDRSRSLLIIKTRGMGHLNLEQQFTINDHGIQFKPSEQALTIN